MTAVVVHDKDITLDLIKNMNKPLIRWVVGPMTKLGITLFRRSVRKIYQIYKKDFNFLICYNNIDKNIISDLGIDLLNQNTLYNKFDKEYDSVWKLLPVRVDKKCHEIIIDSDIFIFKRVPQIDSFLKSDCTLICEGIGLNYGIYGDKIPIGFSMNSGIYGMPPNFDFELKEKKMNWFDEQGLLCHRLISHKHYDVIPQSVIPIVMNESIIEHFLKCKSIVGFHFVGTNSNKNNINAKKFILNKI